MLMEYFDAYARDYAPYKDGAWCYEDGCLYRGLSLLHGATGDDRWVSHLKRLADAQIGPCGELARFQPSEYNIDNILSGRALLRLQAVDADPRYRRAAERLVAQLATHPRTRSDVYWHKLRYPWQVWLDGLYMGLPFQIEYGMLCGKSELVDDAMAQLETALALTFCPETGLYAHGYDESRAQAWADPETGRSAAHWARALGWLGMALADIAELRGGDLGGNAAASATALFRRLVELRQAGGLWLQVPDQPELTGNYAETSASAMLVYAILKARRIGLFDPGAEVAAEMARTLAASAISAGEGGPRMVDICEVAGLGEFQGRYRDGTAAYYVSEARVADDVKGVGPLMMAAAEARMAGIALEGISAEAV